jgi:hypothetical protein
MNNRLKAVACFCLCALFLTSCSTRTALAYDSVIQVQPQNNICVAVDSFQDTRSNPQRIGALRNAYGMPLVKVVTDDSVPMWMKTALEKELVNSGYSITDAEEEGVYHIKGRIKELSSDAYLTYRGKIGVEMTLNQGEEILFKKTYASKKQIGPYWGPSPLIGSKSQAKKCSEALTFNLQKIYKKFIDDVNRQINLISDPNETTPSLAKGVFPCRLDEVGEQ